MLNGLYHVQEMRVGARQALAEDYEATRERVGALYGDGNRDTHVRVCHEVRRPVADARSAHCNRRSSQETPTWSRLRIFVYTF